MNAAGSRSGAAGGTASAEVVDFLVEYLAGELSEEQRQALAGRVARRDSGRGTLDLDRPSIPLLLLSRSDEELPFVELPSARSAIDCCC